MASAGRDRQPITWYQAIGDDGRHAGEVLNFFAGYGLQMRQTAAQAARFILHNANVEVLSILPDDFSLGLALYESHLDKGYSLTDCTAMNAMRRKGITESCLATSISPRRASPPCSGR